MLPLSVVYELGLLEYCHGGVDSVYGVTQACSASKCVCIVSIMVCRSWVISPVAGSMMVERLSRSLAHGWRPDAVCRLW